MRFSRAVAANKLGARCFRTRAATSIAGTASRSHLISSRISQRRNYTNGAQNSTGQDPSKASPSVEEIRLQTEFEENQDIRKYLSRWQETHSNELDPVRGPGTSNPSEQAKPWVGNMLNDFRESASDALRAIDHEMSEFSSATDEGEDMHEFLEPGDLVALSSLEGILGFAVYVRSIDKQQQFYTGRGKWRIAFSKDLDYVVKGFVPRELVAPLHPYFPDTSAELGTEMQSAIEGGVPRHIGAPILRMVDEFSEKVDELYRTNASRLDTIHDVVADEEEKLEFTIEELACKALDLDQSELNDAVLYAVHQATCRNAFIMDHDRSSLFTNYYLVHPKSVAEVLDTVGTWVREHQEYFVRTVTGREVPNLKDHPLQLFIQKAQRLIRLSRKIRSPTTMSSVGPTSQRFQPGQDGKAMVYREVLTERFTPSDQKIIEFLQLWCIPPRRMTSGALRTAGSHIMRSTGMYSSLELSAATVPLLLQELGVISPWENLRLFDHSLSLPGHGASPRSDQMWDDVQQACQKPGSEKLVDTMDGMRTDWGDLPVYCVDDVDAQEIDDGVSLEPVPGTDDTFWIRVHVANPSAFMDSEDLIMKYAALRNQTVYAPERTYPMLPSSLTQNNFSLSSGRPTLTFSAKMNLKGDILETDISNGIVRNVIYITHSKLREFLEPNSEGPSKTLTVGGESVKERSREAMQESLSENDKSTFSTLRQLMLAFHDYRRANGAMELPSPIDNSVSVIAGTAPMKPGKMRVNEGRYFLGDPIIQLRSTPADPHEVPDLTKRNLISTLMNLACWVSGKWCAERNIPAVYDGTWYHPEYPKLTNKNLSDYGGRNWLHLTAPKGISSSSPVPHVSMGLDAYIKSTSPLRRYTDVMAHYQIEAALRFEKQNGRSIDATKDESILPFTKDNVDTYIARNRWKRNRIQEIDRASKQFWACMLLFRAFYFAECALPETFPCLLHQSYSNTSLSGTQLGEGYAGVITSLGVRCHIIFPPDFAEVDILTAVEAKITAVDMSRMLVMMEATRVIKHFERVGEWS
ncbi:hypothetical protein ASPWEDRAFT_173869 [Aspergillus wentii DTO 134E9]|uniref:RNB domain-containing protein n=1 Tax=Aspergillus wentii DTO 134E9 TaxID=1073089 RepID=A0A1L9RHR7_ASPWE|nr:uncharacterized protein ASPWEDRAFT_173869 [Aspergillus wentii DTO 134E9]KAI9925785.1 hypothetical protein MW887_005591 [Aspergillus wentii]OJJ34454.1 hypothetical protein ASPWEDRAFT_173869 [Aspergillus wentii DTO 134E9]